MLGFFGDNIQNSFLFLLFLSEVRLPKHRNSISSRRPRCWRRMEWTLIRARCALQRQFDAKSCFCSLIMCGINTWCARNLICHPLAAKIGRVRYFKTWPYNKRRRWLFVPLRMYLATQRFWLSLPLDSLCCKETGGSISSNGEYRALQTGHDSKQNENYLKIVVIDETRHCLHSFYVM